MNPDEMYSSKREIFLIVSFLVNISIFSQPEKTDLSKLFVRVCRRVMREIHSLP